MSSTKGTCSKRNVTPALDWADDLAKYILEKVQKRARWSAEARDDMAAAIRSEFNAQTADLRKQLKVAKDKNLELYSARNGLKRRLNDLQEMRA